MPQIVIHDLLLRVITLGTRYGTHIGAAQLGRLVILILGGKASVQHCKRLDPLILVGHGVIDMSPHVHIDDHRAVGVELILSLVTSVTTHTLRAGSYRRGEVEAHLGAVTYGILLVTDLELVAQSHVRTLKHRGIVLAAEEEEGNVVRIFGICVLHARLIGVTRETYVARKVAARNVEPQPRIVVTHRKAVRHAAVKQLDIVTAILLIVFQKVGTVLLDPRLQGYALHLVELHLARLYTRGQCHRAGNGNTDYTVCKFHILSNTLFSFHTLSFHTRRGRNPIPRLLTAAHPLPPLPFCHERHLPSRRNGQFLTSLFMVYTHNTDDSTGTIPT